MHTKPTCHLIGKAQRAHACGAHLQVSREYPAPHGRSVRAMEQAGEPSKQWLPQCPAQSLPD